MGDLQGVVPAEQLDFVWAPGTAADRADTTAVGQPDPGEVPDHGSFDAAGPDERFEGGGHRG
jgi:hypothetical protein